MVFSNTLKSMGIFFKWTLYVHWTYSRSIFCVQMTSDLTNSMQNCVPNNFPSESFAQKCVPLPENSKNWKCHFLVPTVALRNLFSIFRVFRQRNAFLGKTLWRKVVWNTILRRSGHVGCHLDIKNGLSSVQWTYKVHLKNIPIEISLYTIFPIFYTPQRRFLAGSRHCALQFFFIFFLPE